jgi:hypothetical protein
MIDPSITPIAAQFIATCGTIACAFLARAEKKPTRRKRPKPKTKRHNAKGAPS